MAETVIGIVAVFLVGGLLVLERHCLGQMAFVQPLIVCGLAGMAAGNETTAVWFGVSLQLLSTNSGRHVNWAVTGVIAAATLLLAEQVADIPLSIGGGSCFVIAIAMLFGMIARAIEREFAKADGVRLQRIRPLGGGDPIATSALLVRRSIFRWFVMGGFEVVLGVVCSFFVLKVLEGLAVNLTQDIIGAIAVPALGVAVTVNTLMGKRFLAWTGMAMTLTWVVIG